MGRTSIALILSLGSAVAVAACSAEERQATTTFYERRIAPVVEGSCLKSPSGSGCHVTADDRGNALGNLSVESYDDLVLRRDLLVDYGPYGMPNLLLKVAGPLQLRLTTWDSPDPILITTDIPHAGGALIEPASSGFTTLLRWMENGAAENNATEPPEEIELRRCTTNLGVDPLFDPNVDPPDADFQRFRDEVNPILSGTCAAGNCHGTPANALYLTCGATDEETRWNYFAASEYVSVDVSTSEILRRTLDPGQGGTFHEGGTIYESTSNSDYRAIADWAEEKGGPSNLPAERGFDFFAKRVQPMLAKKGCMILGCHSPAMFHDYRLRGGSGGHFGLPATRTNYDLSLEQIALESSDPNASRLIRKNLPATASVGGIRHRGGPLFAGAGTTPCDPVGAETGPIDDQDPYCVITRWIEIEREERMLNVGAAPLSGILFVRRPPRGGAATPQDYAQYDPGADLVLASASMDAAGVVTAGGGETSLTAACGLDPTSADIRRPAVSWDGTRLAFAARSSAGEPWRVFTAASDGSVCAPEASINAPAVDEDGNSVPDNGEPIHNFDPAFSPRGEIVFASTRGNTKNVGAFSYQGPQRAPADPSKQNANLYVLENDGGVRQLTFLLNQELLPSFMSDGRVIFTTEKRAPGFYQLAGRRQNLDGGDYHPLFGQRSTIDYEQFTDVVELSDKNLAAIFSDRGATHGAGTLALINRSIGVDQASIDEADYLVDPGAIGFPNPNFYQKSITIVDGAATGKLGGTAGAYKNPSPLPNGDLVVSYAANVTDVAAVSGNFDIVMVDTGNGSRTPIVQGPQDEIWPVAVYARLNRGVFQSRFDEPNGHTQVFNDDRRDRSEITVVDAPLIVSLLFQNTRSGRRLPELDELRVYESLPPEPGVVDFGSGGSFVTGDAFGDVYVRRRLLGSAGLEDDGSVKFEIPGGMPIVLAANVQLNGDSAPTLHHQREEMQFYPGEFARQSFKSELFNGLCGGCHGSVAGLENHIAVNPDILTRASIITARDRDPVNLRGGGGDIVGPPFP